MKGTTSQRTTIWILLLLISTMGQIAWAQFVHPGGLHTQADFNRMQTQVAAGAHPWIDDWNVLITDGLAQNTYTASPQTNIGANRQLAAKDATAAYLNAIRWRVSGDTSYANTSMNILMAWANTVNQVTSGTDCPGLCAIPIKDFALAGEVLRGYSGWSAANFATFQNMFTNYAYPTVNNFLTNHNGACISHYWANWDAANIGALLAMGVLNDNTSWFNQGVSYYQSGAGNGAIANAVYYLWPGNLGQWQESGRDQQHTQLGIGLLGEAAQVAWNQGVDLFSYSSNGLLAGAEYVGQYNTGQWVPYTPYNNCDGVNQYWISPSGQGAIGRPVWELMYNHYAVLQGLSTPDTQDMAQRLRPEGGSGGDHFGYGTLTFTLNAAASPYPPSPIPAAPPTGLTATAGIGNVFLQWFPVPTATGWNVLRATTSGGPYTTIASFGGATVPHYTDSSVSNGTTYYYEMQAANQSGASASSAPSNGVTPVAAGALPAGWTDADVGTVDTAGSASYASVGNNTFLVTGQGSGIGGTADSFNFAYKQVSGDFTLITRQSSYSGSRHDTGVMMRESTDPGAVTVTIDVGSTGTRIAQIEVRSTTGGSMSTVATGNQYSATLPVWYKLQRTGNTFTAYQSGDGVTWFQVWSGTVTMASTYLVGMTVCSGDTTNFTTATSTFDNVGGPAPGFVLSPSTNAQTVTAGQITSYTTNVTAVSGFTGTVNLSVSGLPSGATASFSPTSVTGSGSSTLTVSTSSTTPAGIFLLTVWGTSGSVPSQYNTLSLTVNNTAPDFRVTATGSQHVYTGNSTSYATNITAVNGFTGTVNLSVSGLPSGVTASFNPTSVTNSGSSTLTVSASSTATPGTYWLTITGTSGSLARSTTVSLVVTYLPPGWTDVDIGNPGVAGSASYSSGTFTVNGGGADIWGTSDQFNYVYESASGTTLTARVASQTNTNGSAKAGVMIRDTTAANAAYAFAFVTPSSGVEFEYRSSTGASSANAGSLAGLTAPYWVRLTQSGSTFTAYASPDGTTWTQIGTTATVTLGASPLMGLAVTAHNNAALSTATFDNVSPFPSSPDFSISASPSSQTVTAGASTSYTATVTALNGFTGTVNLSISGLPSGATGSFNPTSVSGSGNSTLSVSTSPTTPAGTYTLTITGTSGSLTHSTTVTLVVNAAPTPDFTIAATPSSQTVTAGNGTTYTMTITAVNGFTGTVNLSVSGLPSGATGSFNPTSVAGSGNSALTVSTSSTTPAGSYTLTITGTSGSLTHSTTVTLVVNAPPSPDFSMSDSPSSQTVTAGASTSYTATVTALNGFTGTVNLSVSGLPTGATGSFSPTSVAGSGNSTLSISTSSTTPAGTYTLTITGTSGSLTHSTTVTLVVNAAAQGDFSISATPNSQRVTHGSSTSYTVTIGALNGFTGTVSLSASGLPNHASASFNPTSVTGSGSSTMTVTTAGNTHAGTYTLTITGTSGSLTHSTPVTLVVQ